MNIPAIKKKAFVLRPLQKRDEAALVRYANNRKVARFLQRLPYPYRKRHAREFIERSLKEYKKRNPSEVTFAIEYEGELVGVISIREIERGHRAEIGYWLGEPFWGKGIMTEALRAVSSFGFRTFGLRRIRAGAMVRNKASQRVLEKAGYVREGRQRKNIRKGSMFFDTYLYAKVR